MPFMKVLENQYKSFSEEEFLKEGFPPQKPNPMTSETLSFPFVEDFTDTKPKTNDSKKKGSAFEIYVGYLYEQKKFNVEYYGQDKHSHDLGRDLICRFKNYTVIVQCKCYKDSTKIGVKEIYSFLGSVKHYSTQNVREIVSAAFWTTQNMPDNCPEAFRAAQELGIQVYHSVIFQEKY